MSFRIGLNDPPQKDGCLKLSELERRIERGG